MIYWVLSRTYLFHSVKNSLKKYINLKQVSRIAYEEYKYKIDFFEQYLY